MFHQVNELVKAGKINVSGRDLPVTVYLGGDYKVKIQYKIPRIHNDFHSITNNDTRRDCLKPLSHSRLMNNNQLID